MADDNDRTLDVSIHDDTSEDAVETVYTSGKRRLCVDSVTTISGDESPTKYQLRSHKDSQSITTGAFQEIFSATTIGLLDFVATSTNSANYEIAIEIDGTIQLQTTMGELGVIGLSNAVNVNIWAENANKNYRYRPLEGSGFSISCRVLARATVSTQTIDHIVLWREKV